MKINQYLVKTACLSSSGTLLSEHCFGVLFYRMLKFGAAYVEQGQTYYEEKYKERLLHNLSKRAKEFGFQLTPFEPATVPVS